MGAHVIPGAKAAHRAAILGHVEAQGAGNPEQFVNVYDDHALFVDPTRTDAEAATLMAGLSIDTLDPIPTEVRDHIGHLRDYLAADPTTITNAQTVHVVRDLIRAVRYLNRRLTDG